MRKHVHYHKHNIMKIAITTKSSKLLIFNNVTSAEYAAHESIINYYVRRYATVTNQKENEID